MNPPTYPTGMRPSAIAAAELNGDGKTDVLVVSWEGLDVLFGNGNGTFGPYTTYPGTTVLTSGVRSLGIGDLDGDGHVDAAITNPSEGTVGVYYGRADGTFAPVLAVPAGNGPDGVAIGDVDSDGIADILVAANTDSTVNLLRGGCYSTTDAPD